MAESRILPHDEADVPAAVQRIMNQIRELSPDDQQKLMKKMGYQEAMKDRENEEELLRKLDKQHKLPTI